MDRVGRYEILDELHRTVFGCVYSARPIDVPGDGGVPRFVVKIYELQGAAGEVAGEQRPELAEQFLERARLQQRLGQDNDRYWAPVHDVGREGEKPYYITDYFPRTAQKLIAGHVVLPAAALYEIISAVAAGLRQLHDSYGRCHGSVKPTNVLISGAGQLGGARIVLSDPLADALPVAIDQQADYYSLGTLLYQLVMHRPFRQTSWPIMDSVEWRQVGKSGGAWRSLCSRLLHPDEANRPSPCVVREELETLAPRGLSPQKIISLATAGLRCLPARKLAAVVALIILVLFGAWTAVYASLSASQARIRRERDLWVEALWTNKVALDRYALYGGRVIDQTDWEHVRNGSRPVPLLGISADALRESAVARERVDAIKERLRRTYIATGDPLVRSRERFARDGYSTAAAWVDSILSAPLPDAADLPPAIDRRIDTARMLASKPLPQNTGMLAALDRWAKSGDRDQSAFVSCIRSAYRRELPLTGAGWGSRPPLEALVQGIDSLPGWPAGYDADRLRRDAHLGAGEPTVQQVEAWLKAAPSYAWAGVPGEYQSVGRRLNADLEEKYELLRVGWLRLPGPQRSGMDGLERERVAISQRIDAMSATRFIRKEYPVAPNAQIATLQREIQELESKFRPPKIVLANAIGMQFVEISAGSFLMGSPPSEAYHRDDEVQHRVTLTRSFLMQTTPVTQGQWTKVMHITVTDLMNSNVRTFLVAAQGEDYPMYYVRQYEADQFCQALGRLDGRRYRLPTEAEWEYVCRAGTKTAYYNGDSEPALAEVAWFRDNSGGKTQPVGRKKPNAWGLYDMIGNVYQWCSDGYEQYPLGAATDPSGNVHSSFGGVIRGGSWGSYPSDCRSAHRDKYTAARGANFIGFRICVDSN